MGVVIGIAVVLVIVIIVIIVACVRSRTAQRKEEYQVMDDTNSVGFINGGGGILNPAYANGNVADGKV